MAMEDDELPLAAPDRSMKIRKDYVPPAKAAAAAAARAVRVQVCPRCGQEVPVDEMAEHLKIELAAPRGPAKGESVFAPAREAALASGVDIAANLGRLARRRTDIFGADEDDDEAARQAAADKEAQRRAASAWDGHAGSTPVAPASIDEQVAAIHAHKAAAGRDDRPQIGPAVPASALAAAAAAAPGGPGLLPMPMGMGMGMGMPPLSAPAPGAPPAPAPAPARPPGMPPGMYAPGGMMAPPPPGFGAPAGGQVPMQMPMQPQMQMQMQMMPRAVPLPPGLAPPPLPAAARPPADDEPDSKRPRTADEQAAPAAGLVPEAEFAAAHSGEYTVRVQVPDADERPDKSDWRFEGQLLELRVRAADTFAALKTRLKDLLLIPPNKQRLRTLAHANLKDQSSLAAYNILPNTVIELSAKERGGRKGK